MSIPPSMLSQGFMPLKDYAQPNIMIGTEGETNTGKSEFGFSCPGPVGCLALDRNIDGVAHNQNPPMSRSADVGIKLIETKGYLGNKGADAEIKAAYLADWRAYHAEHKKALTNPDIKTIMYDASDDWELQRLAEFGTLSQIPGILYDSINAARKRMIREMYDSGKNIIAMHRITDIYVDKIGPDGNPVMGNNGKVLQVKSGDKRRQGFHDYKYLWQIQLHHMYKDPYYDEKLKRTLPGKFGIRIKECKPRMELKGTELWGEDCCFAGLVSLVYPHIALEDWGL